MSEWWASMHVEQQVYWAIAIVATLVIGLQTLMMMIGDVSDLADAGDVDMDGPEEHPSGLHLISSRTLVAFAVGFGWTGVIRSGEGANAVFTALAATVVGLLFGAMIVYLMRLLSSLRHSGTLDYANAIGVVGQVYLPIPPGMGGPGRIEVMIQGRLRVVEALTRHASRLENREHVRVVEQLNENTLVVEPISDNEEQED
jgi:hypothetical protein